MKLLTVNDVHSSDKPPTNRTSTYGEDIWDKLAHVYEISLTHNVDAIAFTGDLFHIPAASRVSHTLVQAWLYYLDTFSIPVLIVPGNHDLAYGRLSSLRSQPIGSLSILPNVYMFEEESSYVFVDGVPITGIPWRYDRTTEEFRELAKTSEAKVILTHAPVMKEPNPFFDTYQPDEISGFVDFICYGHIHPPELPFQDQGTTFVNPGALSRATLSETDINRNPQVAIIDTVQNGVEFINVPSKPARVFFVLRNQSVVNLMMRQSESL